MMFRIHEAGLRELKLLGPREVPWSKVEPLRASCLRAHNQTLERLDERGGLSPFELYCHVHGVGNWLRDKPDDDVIRAWFLEWANKE